MPQSRPEGQSGQTQQFSHRDWECNQVSAQARSAETKGDQLLGSTLQMLLEISMMYGLTLTNVLHCWS